MVVSQLISAVILRVKLKKRIGRSIQTASLLLVLLGLPIGAQSQEASASTLEETLAAEPIPRSKEAVAKLACLRKSIFLDPATRAIWPGRRDETNLNKLDEELRGSRVKKGDFNGQWSFAIASLLLFSVKCFP